MEKLYDLHVHTAAVSSCGQVEPERMAELYQRAGYDGVAVTDHYYARYFEEMGGLSSVEELEGAFCAWQYGYDRKSQNR